MTHKDLHPETLRMAVRIILDAHPVALARAVHAEADGIDTGLANLHRLASAVRSLAALTSDDEQEVANSHLRAMQYGDALHSRLLARSASQYACHIDDAHAASEEDEAAAASLGDEDEAICAAPTDSATFAQACRIHGC